MILRDSLEAILLHLSARSQSLRLCQKERGDYKEAWDVGCLSFLRTRNLKRLRVRGGRFPPQKNGRKPNSALRAGVEGVDLVLDTSFPPVIWHWLAFGMSMVYTAIVMGSQLYFFEVSFPISTTGTPTYPGHASLGR